MIKRSLNMLGNKEWSEEGSCFCFTVVLCHHINLQIKKSKVTYMIHKIQFTSFKKQLDSLRFLFFWSCLQKDGKWTTLFLSGRRGKSYYKQLKPLRDNHTQSLCLGLSYCNLIDKPLNQFLRTSNVKN